MLLILKQDPDRAESEKEREKESTALSFTVSPRVPQSGARNGEFSLHPRSSIRSRGSLSPDSSRRRGTLSENEKAPPPPPEFSSVTIGSLARGTNSGLHDAGPFPAPPPCGGPSVFLDPSCDLPSPPFSPTPLSRYRHGLRPRGAPFVGSLPLPGDSVDSEKSRVHLIPRNG